MAGRDFDTIIKDDGLFERWLNHKHAANQPLSDEQAQQVWDKLKAQGKMPRLDPPHPGTQWNIPHINVDGIHIPVGPNFLPV
jgi:hypothetical protein